MDFAFWDITSRRMFTAVLTIIDAKTRIVNTSGKAGAQILHLPLGDDSSPLGDNAVGR
jgi:hypothetical protein